MPLHLYRLVTALGLAALAALGGCAATGQATIASGVPRAVVPAANSEAYLLPRTLQAPWLLPRSAWTTTGAPDRADVSPLGPARRICVRQEASSPGTLMDGREVVTELRRLHRRQTESYGHADIGSHFYVDASGTVWAARSLSWSPFAIPGHNEGTVAISVLGRFDQQPPSDAARNAVIGLIVRLQHHYQIPVDALITPSDFATLAVSDVNLRPLVVALRSSETPPRQ